ncbi:MULTISPECIES: hypothetical protein [unclassified Tenacibaculum]|uniref:hypothetical protein n=1 Tax=unclassified Tenacibaculum TaxID=2635139 RepID=UPI001F3994C4|nr:MULTISPECIES: hypothetical protein [unclassified Tenacibaculum]MCF2875417.1 hypothetical protein [Tenacibaculum sp. Cn5-1]MCF2935493.1 hypothetical protein [Tenacibaculum sp. Cn5-34]MCG7512053.1 hypothetical protein [Tenacibaculum sp. Cn5-46]
MEKTVEQALIIEFNQKTDIDSIHEFGNKVADIFKNKNLGEYDGHEYCADLSHGTFYMYGESADEMIKGIRKIIGATPFLHKGVYTLRYGSIEDDAEEKKFRILVESEMN